MNNSVYWNEKERRAKKAREWINKTNDLPLGKSTIYDNCHKPETCDNKTKAGENRVMPLDSVSALFSLPESEKVVILNFASYTNPGGKFLDGSSAQEESLCHESNLYQNLSSDENKGFYEYNNKHKNWSFYEDRAIYTENVIFIRGGKQRKADVITCAAPNLSAVRFCIEKGYLNISEDELLQKNHDILVSRITFIRDIISEHPDCHTAILGAYGCGVFKQDAKEVAKIMKDVFACSNIDRIYAIPDGFHRENLTAFEQVFKGQYELEYEYEGEKA